ncbi:MAG: trypsin-like peptidase domain-containing protein [Deltaproteobacteria bacterium]|nr:trypsin-like peptidase domain-containing protein [Deltaproteobacteria bacterium]
MANYQRVIKMWQRWCSIALLLLVTTMGLHEASAASKESLRRSAVVVAVEKVSPAVVNISTMVTEKVNPFFPFGGEDFFKDVFPDMFSREYQRSSLGSGVIIDGEKGYIITNHHVVARATEIKVITSNQKEYKGRSLGSDPRSDLAVIKIDAGVKLPEAKLGNSEDLLIGETVIAIGNPFGLTHTVTTGVVSAIDRSVRAEDRIYRHFIQTDASINPGNSGGPLLNIDGDVIGINTAIYQKAQGIGFAIPITKARRIVKELLRAGEVRPAWLGLDLQDLTPELKHHFALPAGSGGVLVSDIYRDSPADRAGVKRGDVLLEVEGIAVPTLSDYQDALAEFTTGDRITLKLFRRGKEISTPLQPASFPPELALEMVHRRLGIKAGEGRKGGAQQRSGISVEEVKQDSEAARIGLRSGDLIVQVNEIAVTNLEDFKKAISQYHHLISLNLVVRRGPYAYSITLPF